MMKCSCPDALFKVGSSDKIFVDCDAVILDESEIAAACTLSMTIDTPATVYLYDWSYGVYWIKVAAPENRLDGHKLQLIAETLTLCLKKRDPDVIDCNFE